MHTLFVFCKRAAVGVLSQYEDTLKPSIAGAWQYQSPGMLRTGQILVRLLFLFLLFLCEGIYSSIHTGFLPLKAIFASGFLPLIFRSIACGKTRKKSFMFQFLSPFFPKCSGFFTPPPLSIFWNFIYLCVVTGGYKVKSEFRT